MSVTLNKITCCYDATPFIRCCCQNLFRHLGTFLKAISALGQTMFGTMHSSVRCIITQESNNLHQCFRETKNKQKIN